MNEDDKQKMLDILSGRVEKCTWCGSYDFKIVSESRSNRLYKNEDEDTVMRKCKCDCGAIWWDFKDFKDYDETKHKHL